MQQRALAYVGLAFVGLTAVIALGVIWPLGQRVVHETAQFGVALPAPTELVLASRAGVTLVVVSVLGVAALLHRGRHAVLLLVLFGLIELAIASAVGWALWQPYTRPQPVITRAD